MAQKINTKVLMSGAEYFADGFAINAYMDESVPVDAGRAVAEHTAIEQAFQQAGIEVIKVDPPIDGQDGVYTANWALMSGNTAIMSNLPNKRREYESEYAEQVLRSLGRDIVKLPEDMKFSGQGDALPCGKYLFVGSEYRTDAVVWPILEKYTGLEVVGLRTIPQLDDSGQPIVNVVTGWPDSFFYDMDLALAVITPQLIAWCPDAFTSESQQKIRSLQDIENIEVSMNEALKASACNLVSTGDTVIMGDQAPELRAQLEKRGFNVTALDVTELLKGGGFIRCTSLSL